MSKGPDFDMQTAHRRFAVDCFNQAWDLIDKPDRTPEEDEEMVRLTQASHWHWKQREDYTPKNEAISYWQTSRVYALLERAEEARRYGQLALKASQAGDVEPFYLGYAYEALARAEALAGNRAEAEAYLSAARDVASKITEAEDRKLLLDDLETIG
jgi:tetratricopeptide (TPR) repeat protein